MNNDKNYEREIHFGEQLTVLIKKEVREAIKKVKKDFIDEVETAKSHFSKGSLVQIPFNCLDCKKGDMYQAVYFSTFQSKVSYTSFICFECLVKRFQTYAPINFVNCINCKDKEKEIAVLNKIL